ncbi:MAG: spore coat protein U domain-containing protein [Burkholderiales bacterium]
MTAAPSIASRSYNVCAQIAPGQDVSVGSYTDTVVVTVTF